MTIALSRLCAMSLGASARALGPAMAQGAETRATLDTVVLTATTDASVQADGYVASQTQAQRRSLSRKLRCLAAAPPSAAHPPSAYLEAPHSRFLGDQPKEPHPA